MDTIWSLGKNKGINQMANHLNLFGGPKGIRTPVTDVRGQCPRPLDDGTIFPIQFQMSNFESTHSTPRSETRGMLRVDTERGCKPRFKNRGLPLSNVSIPLPAGRKELSNVQEPSHPLCLVQINAQPIKNQAIFH